MAGPEESRVGALTQVEGPSGLAQLRLQLLPVSQRVGELLEIVKYFLGFIYKIFSGNYFLSIEFIKIFSEVISLTLSRTPSDESWSVSTDEGEVREGRVSEIIKIFYDCTQD